MMFQKCVRHKRNLAFYSFHRAHPIKLYFNVLCPGSATLTVRFFKTNPFFLDPFPKKPNILYCGQFTVNSRAQNPFWLCCALPYRQSQMMIIIIDPPLSVCLSRSIISSGCARSKRATIANCETVIHKSTQHARRTFFEGECDFLWKGRTKIVCWHPEVVCRLMRYYLTTITMGLINTPDLGWNILMFQWWIWKSFRIYSLHIILSKINPSPLRFLYQMH